MTFGGQFRLGRGKGDEQMSPVGKEMGGLRYLQSNVAIYEAGIDDSLW